MNTSGSGFDSRETIDAPRHRRGTTGVGDRDLILNAFEQADRAVGSDHPGAEEHGRAPDLPAGLFPGYEIRREIHRGGQGVVYKATQHSTKQTVAIKLMHGRAAIGSSGRSRFEREVHVLGQLDHPGIVNVHDSGVTADGGLYYVMDYVGGKPLDVIVREWRNRAERIRSGSSTSRSSARTSALGASELRDRLELFAKVCEGVNAAHLKGVIHRDLKPANVRLDTRGEPVVVDFGLAKVSDASSGGGQEMTTTGQFIGSMPWSSPEQAEGAHESVDTRSDVYSLGVILYQIITGGRFPYVVVGTMREVMHNIVHIEPERPGLIDRAINDEVETITLKALAKERDRRYQTAGELARDVRRYLAGEPIEAKRDSGWYVLSKTLRRHRLPVGFVAAIAVLTVSFTVALIGKYTEANELRERAQGEAMTAGLAELKAKNERDRAEANFDAVRDLARTFMFDFHDEIEHLRGATEARSLLVTRAAEYLSRLQTQVDAEAAPRRGLLRELAQAYDRLGVLQAGHGAANTGETAEAEASYAKAAAIRAGLLETDPGDGGVWLDEAMGAYARAGAALRLGTVGAAIETCHEALFAFDRALELGASGLDVGRGRAKTYTLLGDLHHRRARSADDRDDAEAFIAESKSWYDKADAWWQVDPGGVDLELWRAELLSKRGRGVGERAIRAVGAVEEGRPGNDDLLAEAERLATAALGLTGEACERLERIRHERPADGDVVRALINARTEQGLAWNTVASIARHRGEDDAPALGRTLESYQAAYAAAQTLAQDLSNLEAQRTLGLTMNKLGNVLRDQGRLDEAELLVEELLAHRRAIVTADPIARHRYDYAIVFWKQAVIAQNRAEHASGTDRAAWLAAAEDRYHEALTRFEALEADGMTVSKETTACRERIEKIRAAAAATP